MKKNLFDKMKILTSLNYISEVDECYFTKKVLGDEVVGYSLEQQTPYELYIHTDCMTATLCLYLKILYMNALTILIRCINVS